jgi:hypothetical protein
MLSLESLPHLCLEHIINYLDMDTVLSLRASCAAMCDFITTNHCIIGPVLTFKTIFEKEYKEIEAQCSKNKSTIYFDLLEIQISNKIEDTFYKFAMDQLMIRRVFFLLSYESTRK